MILSVPIIADRRYRRKAYQQVVLRYRPGCPLRPMRLPWAC